MLIDLLLNCFFGVINSILSAIQPLNIAYDFSLVSTLASYGSMILGSDLMGAIVSSVSFWLSLKFTVGLVIWIYKLLPVIK